MKNLIILILGLLIAGRNSDEKINTLTENNETYLKYSVRLKNAPTEIVYIQEYSFDENGKVVSEKYTNINNPEYNHFSTFKYNNGRILQEIRDGEVFLNIIWTNELAEVYNIQNQKISKFNFNGEILTDYKIGFNTNNIQTKILFRLRMRQKFMLSI